MADNHTIKTAQQKLSALAATAPCAVGRRFAGPRKWTYEVFQGRPPE